MSSTREPPSASASARLHAVVVLPSSGWLLVTAIIRVRFAAAREHERGAQRAERFAEVVRHGLGEHRHAVAADAPAPGRAAAASAAA